MNLTKYFTAPYYEYALDRYSRFAIEQDWPIVLKWEMYQAAQVAFAASCPVDVQRSAFEEIFTNIKRWGAFRGSLLESCWSSERILDTLLSAECSAVSRQDQLTLTTLRHTDREAATACLRALHGIKPMGEYPHMAVSKFLHFFNPSLFPIYDRTFIWNKVCREAFKQDYDLFCNAFRYKIWQSSEQFNWYYTEWASQYIQSADAEFMSYFAQWFAQQIEYNVETQSIVAEAQYYYATAFEFIAIGATYLELSQ